MDTLQWILFNILPMFGFFLALTLLVHQNRQPRSRSSTVAWLLAILLIPYLGVPAYLMFGGRKTTHMTKGKAVLKLNRRDARERLVTQCVDSIFPLRAGNEISLLATGEEAYAALVDLIEHARKSIDIATFILGNDETGAAILAALTRKAAQGVRVRLLLDALGSFGVSKKMLAPLRASGGHCAVFMPMMHLPFRGRANLRNHRKIVVVDNVTAIVGGMNIAREYMGATTDTRRWHDLSLIVKGSVVADLHHVFCSDWQFAAGEEIGEEEIRREEEIAREEDGREEVRRKVGREEDEREKVRRKEVRREEDGREELRRKEVRKEEEAVLVGAGATTALQLVPSGPDVDGDPLYDSIITALFKAQHRVWIVTPFFVPDEMLLKAICIAAKRGVDVRIVVPRVSDHRLADLVRRSYLRQMQEDGAIIHKFTPGMMHGKAILVDNSLGVVGSMNMDMRSFFLNYEVALFIYDESVVKELSCWATDLMSQSVRGIRKANIIVEFAEGVARLLAPLM